MTIRERLERVIEELRGGPGIVVREPRIDPAEFPLDEEYEAELAEDCDGLVFDDAMRSVWGEVDRVEVIWTRGSASVGGILAFEPLSQFATPFEGELHPIDIRDAGMWTAMRMPDELWFRKDVDLRLRGTFADYLELLFKARGADFWPLLLVDLDGVAREHTKHLAMLAKQLKAALEVLEEIETARADAGELLGRVAEVEKVLRKRRPRR